MTSPAQSGTGGDSRRPGFIQRRITGPVRALLLQGLTPWRLALGLAAGAVCGIFPALGVTTLLCVVVGAVFRLNQVALQTANYLVYPLQFLLLYPFFKAGAALFGLTMPVESSAAIVQLVEQDAWQAIVLLWGVSWRAMLLWLVLAVPLTLLLALLLRPPLQAAARIHTTLNQET